jgi:hypothetical protein
MIKSNTIAKEMFTTHQFLPSKSKSQLGCAGCQNFDMSRNHQLLAHAKEGLIMPDLVISVLHVSVFSAGAVNTAACTDNQTRQDLQEDTG